MESRQVCRVDRENGKCRENEDVGRGEDFSAQRRGGRDSRRGPIACEADRRGGVSERRDWHARRKHPIMADELAPQEIERYRPRGSRGVVQIARIPMLLYPIGAIHAYCNGVKYRFAGSILR